MSCPLAHDVHTQRIVRDMGKEIDGVWHLIEHIHVLWEALPSPADPLGQCGARDVLDAFHQFDQLGMVGRPDRCEADPATAHRAGRDTMNRRGRELLVPADLSVVVRVDVDEARRHDGPACVDCLGAAFVAFAHGDDLAVLDAYVAGVPFAAGSIYEGPSDDFQVIHH